MPALVEHTVPLTVTLRVEHADLGSLERAIDAALAEAGRMLWAELMRLLEASLPVPIGCPCGGTLKANGRAPRRLVTLAGEVGLHRIGAHGEGRRPHHLPALQAARDQLVPPGRQPPAPAADPPPQRHLGPLLE